MVQLRPNLSFESSDTPTINHCLQDPENPDFNFINQAFEESQNFIEYSDAKESEIRERCANSPLQVLVQKYLNSKNSKPEI